MVREFSSITPGAKTVPPGDYTCDLGVQMRIETVGDYHVRLPRTRNVTARNVTGNVTLLLRWLVEYFRKD